MSHALTDAGCLKDLTAYEVLFEEILPDIAGYGVVLSHKKTGARVAVISSEDSNKVFSIGFKTLPKDSTGVAHVVEHSVLCGSEHFPVKNPIAELAKGSLCTFFNAMTYPDKTIYPVASCNEKDFANMMEVYLDAVFFPNIYTENDIFLQEGWRYELDDIHGEISYNGVVYNEMKGAFSNPEKVMLSKIQQELFPGTVYGEKSGGDPDEIPNLTRESVLEFHKRYYHPSNSYIFLYGDMNAAERLKWMDEAYLSRFERDGAIDFCENRVKFNQRKNAECFYSVNTEEEAENSTYLSYNIAFSGEESRLERVALTLLCATLSNRQGAPLKTALIDAGIGEEVYAKYMDEFKQPFLSIVAKNTSEDRADDFMSVLTAALEKLVKEGISKRELRAELNQMQFSVREGDSGLYPKGLYYYQRMLGTWLYDDKKVFDNLYWTTAFDVLGCLIETDYFENLIRKFFLKNNHVVFMKMSPRPGLCAEKAQLDRDKLKEYKNSLSKEQLEELVKRTENLKRNQRLSLDREAQAMLPRLTRADLKREAPELLNEVKQVDNLTILHQKIFTGGIAYVKLLFDMKKVSAELLPYVGVLKDLLGCVCTGSHTYVELNNEIDLNTGGICAKTLVIPKYNDLQIYNVYFMLEGKALYCKIPELLSFFCEMVTESIYTDFVRVKEILRKRKSSMERKFINTAHEVALKRATSYFSEMGVAMELMDGVAYYEFITDLLAHYEEQKEVLAEKLSEVCESIFAKDVMKVSVTADTEGYEEVKHYCARLFSKLANEAKGTELILKSERKSEGFIVPGQVQSVCCAGNYRSDSHPYTGAYEVLHTIMNYGYLWNAVRVAGGAYGATMMTLENGRMALYSWRDPNLSETRHVFETMPRHIRELDPEEDELLKYVIGTIKNMDMPLSPSMMGDRGLTAYLTGRTYESLQKNRDEILNVTGKDLRALADGVEAMLRQSCWCVVGAEKKLRDESNGFLTLKRLLK